LVPGTHHSRIDVPANISPTRIRLSAPNHDLTLQQALSELARERQHIHALQARMVRMGEELEVLRGAAFNASTSRLLAEEELDDTRDRLQLALDAAQLGLWEWNIPTGDVILTGTPDGVVNVNAGDEVVTEIDGIGRLVNTLVGDEIFNIE
jgi:PAS domain-containing protein